MNTVVRIKKRHALVGLMVGCSVAGFLFGFTAHAETVNGDTAYYNCTEFGTTIASSAFVPTNAQSRLSACPPKICFCLL